MHFSCDIGVNVAYYSFLYVSLLVFCTHVNHMSPYSRRAVGNRVLDHLYDILFMAFTEVVNNALPFHITAEDKKTLASFLSASEIRQQHDGSASNSRISRRIQLLLSGYPENLFSYDKSRKMYTVEYAQADVPFVAVDNSFFKLLHEKWSSQLSAGIPGLVDSLQQYGSDLGVCVGILHGDDTPHKGWYQLPDPVDVNVLLCEGISIEYRHSEEKHGPPQIYATKNIDRRATKSTRNKNYWAALLENGVPEDEAQNLMELSSFLWKSTSDDTSFVAADPGEAYDTQEKKRIESSESFSSTNIPAQTLFRLTKSSEMSGLFPYAIFFGICRTSKTRQPDSSSSTTSATPSDVSCSSEGMEKWFTRQLAACQRQWSSSASSYRKKKRSSTPNKARNAAAGAGAIEKNFSKRQKTGRKKTQTYSTSSAKKQTPSSSTTHLSIHTRSETTDTSSSPPNYFPIGSPLEERPCTTTDPENDEVCSSGHFFNFGADSDGCYDSDYAHEYNEQKKLPEIEDPFPGLRPLDGHLRFPTNDYASPGKKQEEEIEIEFSDDSDMGDYAVSKAYAGSHQSPSPSHSPLLLNNYRPSFSFFDLEK
jgi:hypothetical protein